MDQIVQKKKMYKTGTQKRTERRKRYLVKIASDPKQRKLFDSKPAVITGTSNEAAQMQMERLEDDAV